MDDSNSPLSPPEPAGLRRLRIMVMVLTGTLTLGFVVIVGLMIATFGRTSPRVLPSELTIPAGETAQAFTQGTGWQAVVTTSTNGPDRIRIFAPDGTERQVIEITP